MVSSVISRLVISSCTSKRSRSSERHVRLRHGAHTDMKTTVSSSNSAFVLLVAAYASPFMAYLSYHAFRLVFGTLYPAYASYKAVKTKNVKEYVKWMMYWIIFALFTCLETFADIFASFWLPFYYELKIIFVLWLLSPYTQGSSVLYRKFVHPQLNKREQEIDGYILQFREKGYEKLMELGSKGMALATNVVLQTAMKGQETLVNQIKKSYSMNDLSQSHLDTRPISQLPYIEDEVDDQSAQLDNRLVEKRKSSRRSLRDRQCQSYREISDSGGDDDLSSSSLGEKKNRKHRKHAGMRLRSRENIHSGGGCGVSPSSKKSIYDEVSAYATLSKTSKRGRKKPPTSD